MRVFRFVTVLVFVLVAGVYGWLHFYNRAVTDYTNPQISFETDVLEVSVTAGQEELLRDVRAWDEKDGDLTNRVIVEKISNFVEKGLSNITYAVVDNDRHTIKASRRIHYTDYRSPRFTFSQPMRFDVGSNFNILKILGAADMIDGDVTNRIKLTGSDLVTTSLGVYQMQAQVTNSKGDVSYLRFNVTITPSSRGQLAITLKDYLIYIERGALLSPESLVEEVSINGVPVEGYNLEMESALNPAVPGQYTVNFKATSQQGQSGETELIVIVEDTP